MRPLRLLLSLSTCLGAILILSYFVASRTSTSATQGSGGLTAYFNWQSSSLFPPSAIISLTDDNSTFFLARPANFGPSLPSKGLNGQLWIGSGFGDDNMGRGGVSASEGELGCSDVPGWGDGDYGSTLSSANDATAKSKLNTLVSKAAAEAKAGKSKRSDTKTDMIEAGGPEQGDGTDDHLHHPLPPSSDMKNKPDTATVGEKLAHADIQSLQETAEIAGKVVLLTRGGCGFLEKAKWVQRRGGSALIVGDNVRGGGLVTMYARGDTSNITIPSLFTSHMTAHLLSSLVPSGRHLDDVDPTEATRLGLALGDKVTSGTTNKPDTKPAGGLKQSSQSNQPGDKPAPDSSSSDAVNNGKPADKQSSETKEDSHAKQSWFDSLLGESSQGAHQDTRRPPSSGKIGWIQQDDFEEDLVDVPDTKSGKTSSKPSVKQTPPSKSDSKKQGEGFVIGVQDWRDPDLLDAQLEAAQDSPSKQHKAAPTAHGGPKGGSITPGSGEYDRTDKGFGKGKKTAKEKAKQSTEPKTDPIKNEGNSGTWLNRLGFSNNRPEESPPKGEKAPHVVTQVDKKTVTKTEKTPKDDKEEPREGLWVTLTPTSMSSSPFFDTLLVLVISPLVTLTIVYALLLLRSRIRRRRWRAPKSVVERLPVRTYHTIPSTNGSNSTENSPPRSPTAPNSSTPLLHSGSRPISQGRARPRSRTESEVPASGTSFRGTASSSIDDAQEKREAGLAEWRRRYVGRQRECVVCLEEYIDGVSRVMSLPCGHEFHAECM